MKNFTLVLLAVAICFFPTFANATIRSNESLLDSMNDYEVDCAQEAMEELVQRSRPQFKNVQSAGDLVSRVSKELKELKELAEFLDIEGIELMIPLESIPKKIQLDLESTVKAQNLISVKRDLLYFNENAGYYITKEKLYNMSEEKWNETCKMYMLSNDKAEFITNSTKSPVFVFDLLY